ncbi:MAG: hypothetical protein HZY73_07890 [Micropruina sp.]|nr:MAG: hypothetical protein HZY73_07890 [Micropruina sp.]
MEHGHAHVRHVLREVDQHAGVLARVEHRLRQHDGQRDHRHRPSALTARQQGPAGRGRVRERSEHLLLEHPVPAGVERRAGDPAQVEVELVTDPQRPRAHERAAAFELDDQVLR